MHAVAHHRFRITAAAPLVIQDKAFAWQGRYTIGLQARVRRSLEQSAGDATRPLDTDASTSRE